MNIDTLKTYQILCKSKNINKFYKFTYDAHSEEDAFNYWKDDVARSTLKVALINSEEAKQHIEEVEMIKMLLD